MRTPIFDAAVLVGAIAVAAHAQAPASVAPRTHAECASLFLKLDTDGDGLISRQEASADPFVTSIFAVHAPVEPDFLTAEEFMAACQKPAAARRHEH
jgi:hypothetical protein